MAIIGNHSLCFVKYMLMCCHTKKKSRMCDWRLVTPAMRHKSVCFQHRAYLGGGCSLSGGCLLWRVGIRAKAAYIIVHHRGTHVSRSILRRSSCIPYVTCGPNCVGFSEYMDCDICWKYCSSVNREWCWIGCCSANGEWSLWACWSPYCSSVSKWVGKILFIPLRRVMLAKILFNVRRVSTSMLGTDVVHSEASELEIILSSR